MVVISNPTALIQTDSKDPSIFEQLIHRNYLPFQISKIDDSIFSASLSDNELTALIKTVKRQNKPLAVSVLKKFAVKKEEIIKGVICRSCNYIPLERINASWHCTFMQNQN